MDRDRTNSPRLERLKEMLADDVLAMSREQLRHFANEERIVIDEVCSQILAEVQSAERIVDRTGKPRVAEIDAAKARAILRRVAARAGGSSAPLSMAASLEGTLADDQVTDLLATLRQQNAISDEDLE